MPTALRSGPYRFFFFSNENNESPHVHVQREKMEVKFWLEPIVELEQNFGFSRHEINEIRRLIELNRATLLEAWHEHFDKT